MDGRQNEYRRFQQIAKITRRTTRKNHFPTDFRKRRRYYPDDSFALSSFAFYWIERKCDCEALVSRENIEPKLATKIAHQAQGNYNKALHLLKDDSEEFLLNNGLWFGFVRLSKPKEMLP